MKIEFTNNNSSRSASWKRWAAIGMLALVGVAGSHGLAAAQNYGFGGRGGPCMMDNPGMMKGFKGDRGFSERRLGYVLDAIKATPEQSGKIKAIMSKAREDMLSTRQGFTDTRGQFADILGSPTIDKAAIEKMRADRIQAMDDASKKRTAAMLEVAEVLTPEQRAQLLQHFKERRAFKRW